ncbi:ATP-binding cassette domain-containing protein [Flavobacterium sp.]|uniref:ABC transporter ATP-binding protein n=1 Tax=Flavobacterium sp. TaxID=239 RepID=UPI002625B1FC|nr:ATP-binding cassette domain-containing protein [Flavobacterium sp.]MDD3004819.1 ATP-binding cassette domain-containing protein [Flavobacterium sp.]
MNPSVNNTEEILVIQDLTKSFETTAVLKGLTLSLKKGENLVILGKSGTGKSVLIKCIVRLLKADSGSIKVLGEEITALNNEELNKARRKIGFLFQSGALYDSMTVRENLEFPLKRIFKNLSKQEIEEKVKNALENVGLPDSIDKMPSELSGGMRKRISLARTIIVDPEIMLYDEPTTGLDPVTSHEISLLINEVQEKYKTSSIIITHDIECAKTVANRIIMLQDGEVYKEGSLSDFENSEDELVKSYFRSQNITNTKTI